MTGAGEELLSVDGVTVRYGKFVALKDVTMHVRTGAFHGVLGPNGAGKSTLMDAISGRRRVTTGSVTFKGQDITKAGIVKRRHMGLGRSFQRTSIFPEMTVAEQFGLVGRHVGERDVDSVIQTLSLGHLRDSRAGQIAYGDQRRIDIGLALLGHPSMLVLDEPAAGLSVEETDSLFTHLAELVRDRGVTALVVEHDVDAVFAFCDEVTVLDMGQVLCTADPVTVRANPAVITAYLGSAA
jgi:branched-chain amino acid transport system ATP-binding protein